MRLPLCKYDAVKIQGIDRLFILIDVVPDYHLNKFIVRVEDAATISCFTIEADLCEFVELGQMRLFDKNEE